MNVIIFSLTILVIYGIMMYAYKAWNRADIKEKMNEIKETEKIYEDVMEFKKEHGKNIDRKKDTVEQFKI